MLTPKDWVQIGLSGTLEFSFFIKFYTVQLTTYKEEINIA